MRDVYQEVTNRIVTALEQGTVPWLRPWRDDHSGSALEPYNAATGRPYNGINLLILGSMPYADLGWMTFKQALDLGGNVRKGERGTGVIFWKFETVEDEETGKKKTVPFARMYTVFNVSQCDNIAPEKLKRPAAPAAGQTDMNALASRVGAIVRHGGDRAFYTTNGDFVQMPSASAFKSPEHYQATLAHELTHWTGHSSRCAREFGKRFGDEAYAFEELVAEIGSAFLCAQHGIALEQLQHPAYVASWLKTLKNDKRAIFTAASKAKEAAGFLLAHGEEETAEQPVEQPAPVAPVVEPPAAPIVEPAPAPEPRVCRAKGRKWRKYYGYRPIGLGKERASADTLARQANAYVRWLAEQRGWSLKEAREYAMAQPRGGLISATLGSDDDPLPIAA